MLASRLQARPLGQPQAQARQTAEESSCWVVDSHRLPPSLQSSLSEPHSHITHLKDGETEGLSDLLMAIWHRVGHGIAGWAPVAGLGACVCSGPSSITGVVPTSSRAPGAGPAWACTMLSLGRALPVECLPSSTRKLPNSYALPSCLPTARVWGGWAEGPVSEPKGHSAGRCSPLQGVGVAMTGGWLSGSWGPPEADGAFFSGGQLGWQWGSAYLGP